MTEHPWLILTLRRTGGTSLATFLNAVSRFDTLEHEPLNRDRCLGHLTRAFAEGGTHGALRTGLEQALSETPNIKHCLEVVRPAVTQTLIDVCAEQGYRVFVLTRRDEARRLASLFLARSTGAWGVQQALEIYPLIRTGQRVADPIELSEVRRLAARDRRALSRTLSHLGTRHIPFQHLWYEDLYQGDAPLTAQAQDLAACLGAPVRPKHLALLQGSERPPQRSQDIAPYVRGYEEAVALLDALCDNRLQQT